MSSLLIALLSLTVSAPAPRAPSVLVLPLRAEVGMEAGAANLLTDLMIQRLRDEQAFSRVVGLKEMQDVISFEQQRQLISCDNSSCLLELAGAFGVDMVVTGSLGQLGRMQVINLKLLEVKTGRNVASVSHTEEGGVEVLVARFPVVVRKLLSKADLVSANAGPVVDVTHLGGGRAASENVASGGRWYRVGGLASLAAAVPSILAGLGLLGLAAAVTLVPTVVPIATPLPLDAKKRLLLTTGGLLGTVGTLASVLAMALVAGGMVALGVGTWGAR